MIWTTLSNRWNGTTNKNDDSNIVNALICTDALSKVEQVRGVNYTRIDNDERGTGVIAQELEAVLPEAVREDHTGTKTVAYGNVVGLLIEAIKELSAKIKVLEAV